LGTAPTVMAGHRAGHPKRRPASTDGRHGGRP